LRAHLTEITVRALKPCGAQFKVWDTTTPGFGVLVGKRKSYFVMYGRQRAVKIVGRYPDTPLSDARRAALVLLGTRPKHVPSPTFNEALDAFFDQHVSKLNPRTQREIKRVLNRHFLPDLKGKKLGEITHRDIAEITSKLLHTPSEAWHAFKDARVFFNWCVPRYIPHSPCTGLKPPTRYVPRRRVLSDDEIKAIWTTLEAVDYPFSQILKLLILTGCRYSEIASLRWSYIDEKQRTISLPTTKNKDEHTFPYGRRVAQVLETIPRLNSTDFLFPGRDKEQPWNGAGKAKWQLDKLVLIAPWQLLDCRRTFGTKLAELKVPPHIVERLLNHKLGTLSNQTSGAITAVAEVYNRYRYLDEMRTAITAWEKRFAEILK
jgi:integrase